MHKKGETIIKKHRRLIISILIAINALFSFGLSFAFWASEVSGHSGSGIGTVPIGDWGIPIFTASEFYTFATKTDSALTDQYYLANDIDFTGFPWNYDASNYEVIFRGTLNGNGKKLINLTITNTSINTLYAYNGIFPRSQGSTIYKLTLENVNVVSNLTGSNQRSGLLIGEAQSGTTTLSNIKVINSTVQGTHTSGVGGLVGSVINSGTVVNLTNIKVQQLKVYNHQSSVGGLVGRVGTSGAEVHITDVDFIGEIHSNLAQNQNSASNAGGLIGQLVSGARLTVNRAIVEAIFENTFVTGANINQYSNRYLGGIIGSNGSTAANVSVTHAFYTGSLYTRLDARRNDIGTISGQGATAATVSNSFHSFVAYRNIGGAITYTNVTPTGQMAQLVNATALPTQSWWNTFYLNFTSNPLWLQNGTGRPYLNL